MKRRILGMILLSSCTLMGCRFFTKKPKPETTAAIKAADDDQPTRMRVTNHCDEPIWMDYKIGTQGVNFPGELQNHRLATGQSIDYPLPDIRLEALRFWPKVGCDANGKNCDIGQSEGNCEKEGCQPPIESKFEATFADPKACEGKSSAECVTWYNASHVDGYTLPYAIIPKGNKEGVAGCEVARCDIDVNSCPSDEMIDGKSFDLRVKGKTGKVVGCISPCKRLNYPAPWGFGIPEEEGSAKYMCCPTPPLSSGECSAGPIEKTKFVNHIRQVCHNVYTYAYDDTNGLHTCSATTKFEVIFCPKGGPRSGTGVGTQGSLENGAPDSKQKTTQEPPKQPTTQEPPKHPTTQEPPKQPTPGPTAPSENVCTSDPRVNKSIPVKYDEECLKGGAGCVDQLPCRYY